jgi:hypothetical protein
MASSTVLIDEFHLTVFVPRVLRSVAYRAVRRTLDDPRFRERLRRAIRDVFGRYPSLSKTRFTLLR